MAEYVVQRESFSLLTVVIEKAFFVLSHIFNLVMSSGKITDGLIGLWLFIVFLSAKRPINVRVASESGKALDHGDFYDYG